MAVKVTIRKSKSGGYRAAVVDGDELYAAVYAPTREQALAEANHYAVLAEQDSKWLEDPWESGA